MVAREVCAVVRVGFVARKEAGVVQFFSCHFFSAGVLMGRLRGGGILGGEGVKMLG